MNPYENDQLGAGLVYEDMVPMHWRKVETEIQPAQLIRINESNEEILRFISVLDDYRSESTGDGRGSGAGDISRIEHKINLILDLVSQILVHHIDMPAPVPIRMSATGIQWRCEERLELGHDVLMDIYFYHNYPRPITLAGKVQHIEKDGDGYNTWVIFENLSDTVRQWLDKLIFRHHRRGIAYARQHTQGANHSEPVSQPPDDSIEEKK